METIEAIITKQIESAPKRLLLPILARKLKEAGIDAPDEVVDAFADHIFAGNVGSFQWSDGQPGPDDHRELTITLTEADSEELSAKVKQLTDDLPTLVLDVAAYATTSIYKRLIREWPLQSAIERYEVDEFCDRLEERWGEGLDLLRLLLACCREIGRDADKRYRRSKSRRHACRRFVLTRLQVRACQVADEIITLLENGFADGAMARWRTLHELGVVATLIADGDEVLAERYINHDIVDVKRQADDYDLTQVPLGLAPISKRERKKIDAAFSDALQKYGQPFASPYGWAAERLGMKRPTFEKLQEEAGRASMTSYYKLASYNVHAGARSMFHRLTAMGQPDLLIAGRSNAGLMEPARNTAHSLLLITSFMEDRKFGLDRTAELNAVLNVRDATVRAFKKADNKLHRDERALLRSTKSSKLGA